MRKLNCSGLTFAEMMIATTIGVTVLVLATESFVTLYKNIYSATAYRNVHEDARRSLAWISKDVRASSNIVSWVSNDITLTTLDSTGGAANVRFYLSNSQLLRTSGSRTNTLTQNLTSMDFSLYNKAGGTTTGLTNAYEVRAYLAVSNVSSYRISSDILQTRVRMRNKP